MSDTPVRPPLARTWTMPHVQVFTTPIADGGQPVDGHPAVVEGVHLLPVIRQCARIEALSGLNWERGYVHLFHFESDGRNLGWSIDNWDSPDDEDTRHNDWLVAVADRPRSTGRSVIETLIHEFAHQITDGHGVSHGEATLLIGWQIGLLTADEYLDGLARVRADGTPHASQVADAVLGAAAIKSGLLDRLKDQAATRMERWDRKHPA